MLTRLIYSFLILILVVFSGLGRANDSLILADTSSPARTLSSFMSASDVLISHWQDENLHQLQAQNAYSQAIRTMDLSLVPNRSRKVVVMERIILLREILDRIDLDVLMRAPDIEEIQERELRHWRFANTDIALALQSYGDKTDQFLFSSTTIQMLPRWYRTMEPFKYSGEARVDYYQEFLTSPGPLFSKQFIQSLPERFNQLHGPLPLWQWIALAMVISVCKILISLSFKLGKRWNERWENRGLKWRIGQLLALIGVVFLLLIARRLIDDGIWVTGSVYQFLSTSFLLAQFFFVSWFILAIFNYFAEIYVFKKHKGKHVESSLITVLSRIFGGLTIAILGIYVIEFMGFSISPILAGLGVGGLAVALAIRPVLENVINGLTLYADGGIKIGELCRYGSKLGTIESIGLRSTRIRTLERSLITIPNSEFANMEIDNLERRDKRRMEHILRLRPEVTLDQLRVLIVNIRRLLIQHPMFEEDPVRVRLVGMGDYSINLSMMGYISCRDNEEFMAVQEDVLFSALAQVESVGAKTAYSTEYQFVDRHTNENLEQKLRAAQAVAQWHEKQAFPFPDFSYEYKYEMKDTIMYPAKTSAVRQR
ncbi:mechanosensitive ion channel family protein [Shewanella atlantica]|uniref:Mechanosensitive ion channel family protein n=1 Tax=Shewanella atlantica TaxID=271099 RepID=A0A431WD25_9GAMM|nr:mechanosensitive ion channel family protein [Shewanella atlantica]RTR33279.1 mechanosensitive ion channel family protein [Shewanella atlantica]